MYRPIRTAVAALAAAALMALAVTPASAAPSTETKHDNIALGNSWWLESPTEITTDQVTTESYKSQIQQPINPDNTSTWPAKRGVIPVQFKLAKSSKTVETVTKVPSFQSIGSDNNPSNDWSALTHVPPAGTTVNSIEVLKASFNWLEGTNNHGGSLRWTIHASGGDIWAYYGPYPNFGNDGAVGGPGSGDNLITADDLRFDASPRHGPTYATWNDVENLYGSESVDSVALIVESGWQQNVLGGDQKVDLQSATVNSSTKTIDDSYTSTETLSEVVGATTNEPPAKILVQKVAKDGTPLDVVEQLSSAQGDTSGQFRQIDGKYMYNLKAETLGAGNFQVFMVVDGYGQVMDVFELR